MMRPYRACAGLLVSAALNPSSLQGVLAIQIIQQTKCLAGAKSLPSRNFKLTGYLPGEGSTSGMENNNEVAETEAPPASRRNFLVAAGVLAVGALTTGAALAAPRTALAVDDAKTTVTEGTTNFLASSSASETAALIPVYFGVGCFWHIQHEFVQAERDILGRDDHQLTSRAGYAGGKAVGSERRVCYHNFQRIADYGSLGHGEVVGMDLPEKSIGDFAKVYFSLFNPKTKDRVDPMDRGGEYRSLIGLPGGVKNPEYTAVEAAATDAGFTLQVGKGNDPDTLGKQLVYLYDTASFPFHQAEVYHQYHDDFQSPPYGKRYNKLADLALDEGRIQTTGCPDRV